MEIQLTCRKCRNVNVLIKAVKVQLQKCICDDLRMFYYNLTCKKKELPSAPPVFRDKPKHPSN
jgi:hypothetical protein